MYRLCSKLVRLPKTDKVTDNNKKTLAYYMAYPLSVNYKSETFYSKGFRGRIFSHVRPFFECAVSNLDRSMHRSLCI